jgi:hypothetical protein
MIREVNAHPSCMTAENGSRGRGESLLLLLLCCPLVAAERNIGTAPHTHTRGRLSE